MSSEHPKFSKLPSEDSTSTDPSAEQQTAKGTMEEQDHPPFVTTSESSQYNMIPDPKFAREYLGPGPIPEEKKPSQERK